MLLRAFGLAIDLQKYGISSSDFLMYKLVLLLYCLDYGAQRYAFVQTNNRALLLATGGGLVLCGLATVWILDADFASATSWFIPLLIYQSFAALLAAALAAHNPRRSTVRH
jgi:tryptophan-rich sensory protein